MTLGVRTVLWVRRFLSCPPTMVGDWARMLLVTPHVCLFPHYTSQIIYDMAYGVLVGQLRTGPAPESRPERELTPDAPWKQCRIWQLPDLVGGIFSLGTNMLVRADSVKC